MSSNQNTQFSIPNPIVTGTMQNDALISHQGNSDQPIIIQLQTNTIDYNQYPSKAATVFGIAQIVIGLLCIMFGILTFTALYSHLAVVGHGVWCGVMFTIAGSFTVAAGRHKNLCLIITSMVLSIIAAVFVFGIVVTSSLTISITTYNYHDYNTWRYWEGGIVAEGMMLGLALFELLIAILSAALGCHTVCCCKQENRVGQPQIVYLPNIALSSMQTTPGAPPNYNDALQMAQPSAPSSQKTEYNGTEKQLLV